MHVINAILDDDLHTIHIVSYNQILHIDIFNWCQSNFQNHSWYPRQSKNYLCDWCFINSEDALQFLLTWS